MIAHRFTRSPARHRLPGWPFALLGLALAATLPGTAATSVGWGHNPRGATVIPEDLQDVIQVIAGAEHSLALSANGSIRSWGSNLDGELAPPSLPGRVVALAGGDWLTLALRDDGSVIGWGNSEFGATPIPQEATDILALDCGVQHVLALRRGGTVIAWGGSNFAGQNEVPTDLTQVVQVAAGYGFSVALQADGRLVAWGRHRLAIPSQRTDAVSIAAGWDHLAILHSDGTVAIVHPTQTTPASIAEIQDAVAIAAGWHFTVVLRRNGSVVEDPISDDVPLPANLTGVTQISAHGRHALALVGTPPLPSPRLEIRYESDHALVSFSSDLGRTYALESIPSLNSSAWRIDAIRHGSGDPIVLRVPADHARLFRLRTW